MTHGEKYEAAKIRTAFLRKMNWAWISFVCIIWILYFIGEYHPDTTMLYAWIFATLMGGFNLSFGWRIYQQEKRIDELWKLPENKAKYNEEITDEE